MRPIVRSTDLGFTLIEMMVVITITGILLSIVSLFIERPLIGLLDTVNRAELASRTDTALSRIKQDLQHALPNSVRITHQDEKIRSIEFIPIFASGRYCTEDSTLVSGILCNPLDFTQADADFDTIGPPLFHEVGTQPAWVVIYNLGALGSDAYAGRHRAEILEIVGQRVLLTHRFQFPFPSQENRFQVVGMPVRYVCNLVKGTLSRHWDYGWQETPPTVLSDGRSALLLTGIKQCHFRFTQTRAGQNGFLYLTLQVTQNEEKIDLVDAVYIHHAS